jgi:hypothetical protein
MRSRGHGIVNYANEIVAAHGGKITVQSEMGKGTHSQCTLPVKMGIRRASAGRPHFNKFTTYPLKVNPPSDECR